MVALRVFEPIDRAHWIGQKRTVFAYRLIATDTVEQRVPDLQQQERALAAGLLGDGAAGGGMQDMTAEDLEMLLSWGKGVDRCLVGKSPRAHTKTAWSAPTVRRSQRLVRAIVQNWRGRP